MANATDLEAQLDTHISELEHDPSTRLDERLFDSCVSLIAVKLSQQPQKATTLLVRLSTLLPQLQQDPSPVIRLLANLVEPLTFADVLLLQPPVDFVAGLDGSALPFNLLVLKILKKAARNAKDAALLAGMPGVLQALVKLWLSTPDMGVSETSSTVLLDLLKIDMERGGVPVHGVGDDALQSGGQGLVWRRLFGDKDVYSLLYSIPSFVSNDGDGLSKREKSVAQARLLSLLPEIGILDWDYLTRSHHSEIETRYGVPVDQGLLQFASVHLVDYKDDVLLHMNLIQFFAHLISLVRTPSPLNAKHSVSLDFLTEHKLHDRTILYWLNPESPDQDPVDLTFLYGPSAHYISVYTEHYASAFLSSNLFRPILQRLSKAFAISNNQWAHGQSPQHDLSLLSALPRLALLPQPFLGTGIQSSPLFLLPSKVTIPDVLHTLAKILSGPSSEATFPPTDPIPRIDIKATEASIARLLFHLYLGYHPTLSEDLVTHADTVALPEKALAALTLLGAIIAASWSDTTEIDTSNLSLPAETNTALQTATQSLHSPLPKDSIDTLLRPPARDVILPFLLAPPRQFTNLVGGRGDTDSAAYRIAMGRWDLMLLFKKRLDAYVPERGSGEDVGLAAVRGAMDQRVSEGVWGVGGEVGGRIGTLEL